MAIRRHSLRDEAAASPASARPLFTTLVAMVRTRFELLHADLMEERESLIAQVRLTVIAGASGLLTAMAALICIAVAVPEPYRLGVLVTLVVVFGGLTAWAWNLRSQYRLHLNRPFNRLLEQLSHDSATILDSQRLEGR